MALLSPDLQTRLYCIFIFLTALVVMHFFFMFILLYRHYHKPDRSSRLKALVLAVFCIAVVIVLFFVM